MNLDYKFPDWDTLEMLFEESIHNFDTKHSSDDSHHSLEAFKESLIRDFQVQVNVIMQPRFGI